MKKIIAVCMLCAACIGVLAGCAQEDLEYSIGSYDEESRISVSKVHEETDSQSEDSSDHSGSNETFLIKHKIYSYEENNVAIVDVTNETDTDCEFTITGKYLDADGNTVKTESQTFLFPADYQKYFLFKPDVSFSKFAYEVETKETTEICYAKCLRSKFIDFFETDAPIQAQIWQGNYKFYPTLMAEVAYSFECQDAKHVGFPLTWMIFDENDTLLAVFGNTEIFDHSPNPSFKGSSSLVVYQTTNDSLETEIRQKFKGKIKAILAVGNQDLTLFPPAA
ncbi:MAG: hypothetical protein IJD82_05430 [Clostridia bacterium]|nr:hypothetical protein [Clostridia bacterium]